MKRAKSVTTHQIRQDDKDDHHLQWDDLRQDRQAQVTDHLVRAMVLLVIPKGRLVHRWEYHLLLPMQMQGHPAEEAIVRDDTTRQ